MAGEVSGLFRRSCSQCGSPDLRWVSIDAYGEWFRQKHGPDAYGELIAVLEVMAGTTGPAEDAWICELCGDSGMFGALVMDGWPGEPSGGAPNARARRRRAAGRRGRRPRR